MFRALKTKKDTPKYGLIYHAQLIGQASVKNKGKMSRSLAAKAALATRVDAFGEDVTFDLGTEHKVKLEARLRLLEEGNLRRLSGTGKAKSKFEKYHVKTAVVTYPTEADNTMPSSSKKRKHSETVENTPKKKLIEDITPQPADEEGETAEVQSEKKKKKKKNKEAAAAEEEAAAEESFKSPKPKKIKKDEDVVEEETPVLSEKKKKKKKKQQSESN